MVRRRLDAELRARTVCCVARLEAADQVIEIHTPLLAEICRKGPPSIAVDRRVVDRDTALGHHRIEITVVDGVAAIPPHGPQLNLTAEMPSLKSFTRQDIALWFDTAAPRPPDFEEEATLSHGRIEQRAIWTTTQLNAHVNFP